MAHAAPTAPGAGLDLRHLGRGAWTRPLLAGLVYGVWAAFIQRHQGPVDAGNVFYGILCGVVFAAIMFALARFGPRLAREPRAAAYAAFGGIAIGYLHSLTNQSLLRSVAVGLGTAVGVGVVAFYRYYTRED
ncbi:hypothetical protein ACN20G_12880 [Streptomyces sp. BI20]|uniref:hypothetical protein n=1 Tax=Streptomyces sp. BI20 TaxID=3403460 RepID=UPI003C757C14